MKVYVITKGIYSDYHICAVATDEEKAKVLAKKYSDIYEKADYEVYESDENADDESDDYVEVWHILISSNGLIVDQVCSGYAEKHREVNSYNLGSNLIFEAYVKEKDIEKAVKIAQDRRAKMLAERFGL